MLLDIDVHSLYSPAPVLQATALGLMKISEPSTHRSFRTYTILTIARVLRRRTKKKAYGIPSTT